MIIYIGKSVASCWWEGECQELTQVWILNRDNWKAARRVKKHLKDFVFRIYSIYQKIIVLWLARKWEGCFTSQQVQAGHLLQFVSVVNVGGQNGIKQCWMRGEKLNQTDDIDKTAHKTIWFFNVTQIIQLLITLTCYVYKSARQAEILCHSIPSRCRDGNLWRYLGQVWVQEWDACR